MKFSATAVLVLIIFGAAQWAHAEGGCPEGFYPSSDPAIVGCAPIPGYTGNMGEEDSQAPSRARWIKTWGAIAYDKELGILGAVTGKESKRDAVKAAVEECVARGGGDGCENIAHSYKNQCAVALVGDSYGIITAGAETEAKARASGMSLCREKNINCRDYYAACSEPIRIK